MSADIAPHEFQPIPARPTYCAECLGIATDGIHEEYQPYPLAGDPAPVACRHCGRDTIPTFGAWMDADGLFRCPSDWTEHAPRTASTD